MKSGVQFIFYECFFYLDEFLVLIADLSRIKFDYAWHNILLI
jgi:hypothetical protein